MAQNDLVSPIGRPLDRVDGALKVTGRAKYAFEYAAQHYFGRFLSDTGFPNQFFDDSWVVGLWRG